MPLTNITNIVLANVLQRDMREQEDRKLIRIGFMMSILTGINQSMT